MQISLPLTPVLALLLLPASVRAATQGQVDLEIAGDTQLGAGMSFQEWGRALANAGVKSTLRSANDGDKPGIEVGGTPQAPIYKVTGVIGPGDVLFLPGARFRRSESKKIAAWVDDLAKRAAGQAGKSLRLRPHRQPVAKG